MGTDCKSAAFSFGGSNPPAPTKKTSVENTLVFFFVKTQSHTLAGGFEQLRPGACVPPGKKPRWGFFSSAARRAARAHQKDQRRKYAGLFLSQKPKVTPSRVDSNSCGPALAFRREKSPGGAFLAARLADPPAPTKKTSASKTDQQEN